MLKKLAYILSVLLVALLLVTGMLLGALSTSKVQTAAVHMVTSELSRALGSKAVIGDIEYRFPSDIVIHDIYLEDPQADTLAYLAEARATLHPFELLQNELHFSYLGIHGMRAKVYTLPDGTYNYQYLIDFFSRMPHSADDSHPLSDVRLDKIELDNLHLTYDTYDGMLEHAAVRLRHLTRDSINAEILTLQAQVHESALRAPAGYAQDFEVLDLQAHLIFNDTLLSAPTLFVMLPHSMLDASGVRIDYPAAQHHHRFRQDASDIKARVQINRADIRPADLGFFVQSMRTLDGKVSFMGHLAGTLDSLSATDLAVYYNDYRLIYGDISTVGLPDIRQTHLTAHCQDLSLNAAVAQDFLSDLKNHPYTLPSELRRVGDAHYRGTIQGHLNDLSLQGAFRTALGTITTSGQLVSDTTFSNLSFRGKLDTRRFRLGRLLPESGLGDVALSVSSSGTVAEGQFPEGVIHAHVDSIRFRDYAYRDICLHGNFSRTSYEGELTIDDENLRMAFNGICDRRHGEQYDFDLRLDRFEPAALNLTTEDVGFRMNTHVNLTGFDPDRLSGYLVVDSLFFRNHTDSLIMQQLQFIAECDTSVHAIECPKSLSIVSDFFTAKVTGRYAYTTLFTSLQKVLVKRLPSAFPQKKLESIRAAHANNQLSFYVYGRELKSLQRVLRLPWRVADYPVIKGSLDDRSSTMTLQAHAENIRSASRKLTNIVFTLDAQESLSTGFSLNTPADTLFVNANATKRAEPIYIPSMRINIGADAAADSLLLHLAVDDKSAETESRLGELLAGTSFSHYAGQPFVNVHLLPSSMQYGPDTLRVSDSHIVFNAADTTLSVDQLFIGTPERYISMHGLASPSMEDSLYVHVNHIDASWIMPFVLNEEVLSVQGDLSGWAYLYGAMRYPTFAADVTLLEAGLNHQTLGDIRAKLDFDRATGTMPIIGVIMPAGSTDSVPAVAAITGLVEPAQHRWGLDIQASSVPLGFINHWTSTFLDQIGGNVSGHVQVLGYYKDVWVLARVLPDNAHLHIPFTGCTYYINDSVFMDSTSIRFPSLHALDEEGNTLIVDGGLTHESFRDFYLDIRAKAIHTLAFNLPDCKGELMSGHVYADGDVHIYGPDTDIHLDAQAATFGKSRFRFSIDGASSAHDNSFITFVHPDQDTLSSLFNAQEDEFASLKEEEAQRWTPSNKFSLSMGVDATERNLLFQLVINEQTGDMIQARGDGAIRFTMDPNEDISLMGTYTCQSGSLGFTVGNVIRRDFKIAEGSTIIFSGNPENPILDVTAKYHVVASLRDLFGDDISSLGTTRTSVPVECCAHLTGPLNNPAIRFSLELPMSEDAIRMQVLSIINTDEMLMRQVVYLLIFGRFFTPEYLQTTTNTGANEVYSLLSSTITGQINSWLGKLTNVFTMGVNIRTEGEGATSSQEYEAQFQLQPVDRLVINGNVGYRYNDISNRPFFGDVDIEYMLTESGKVRLKAYTHTVDKYSLRQASTIQGVGLIFRHDFNWPTRKKSKPSPITQPQE